MLIFSKVQPIFKDYTKVQSYIFSFVFSFLQQCMRAGAVIQQYYPYFCPFQHPFCCKTKLGGHSKGGVIPFSFFKINVTGNIYKPERLVWQVNCSQNIVWKVQYALFQLGSWTSWCFTSYYWKRYLVDVRSPTPIMAHLQSGTKVVDMHTCLKRVLLTNIQFIYYFIPFKRRKSPDPPNQCCLK